MSEQEAVRLLEKALIIEFGSTAGASWPRCAENILARLEADGFVLHKKPARKGAWHAAGIRMREAGASYKAIGGHFGVSASAVRQMLIARGRYDLLVSATQEDSKP